MILLFILYGISALEINSLNVDFLQIHTGFDCKIGKPGSMFYLKQKECWEKEAEIE